MSKRSLVLHPDVLPHRRPHAPPMLHTVSPAPLPNLAALPGGKALRSLAGRSRGAVTIEFALVAMFAFLPLLLVTIELGRLFYLTTTLQEVTRRAARAQVVRWVDQAPLVQRYAVFQDATGDDTLPGGPEITAASVRIEFYETYANAQGGVSPITGGTVDVNYDNCLKSLSPCIRYVRATLLSATGQPLRFRPVTGLFDQVFDLPLPGTTVIMPAEALGLL